MAIDLQEAVAAEVVEATEVLVVHREAQVAAREALAVLLDLHQVVLDHRVEEDLHLEEEETKPANLIIHKIQAR